MTPDVVDRFLRKMLGDRWPDKFTLQQREFLMRDTEMEELQHFAPDLAREAMRGTQL